MEKTIGIMAHVDAGKTTFSEQILYHTGAIRRRGRVDHGDAFLDFGEIERARGITVFTEQAAFEYRGDMYYLLDTPGHADFSAETERCAAALDCAVLLVSAVEGVQAQTYMFWRILDKLGVPTVIFINKTDREGADVRRIMDELAGELTERVVLFSSRGEDWKEAVAMLDEELLEKYVSGEYADKEFDNAVRLMVGRRLLFPVMSGSALNDIGISEFLEELSSITAWNKNDDKFSAYVYKVRHENGKRVCYMKINGGQLRIKDSVQIGGGIEKVNELRRYSGSKWKPIDSAGAGSICAAVGLSAQSGTYIGAEGKRTEECAPLLSAKVEFDESVDARTVLAAFRTMEDEEPALSVKFDETLSEIHANIMGAVQTEILAQLAQDRFGICVSFGKPGVIYKETISSPVIGSGHFEPLRHYAEVRFLLSPLERGAGICFESVCPTDMLAAQYQNLIRTHVFEKEHKGTLTGSELTDVKITLIAGRAHLKHTEGGDFRQAAYRAIRQGLCKTDSVLLEPYYRIELSCGSDCAGKIIADIQRMGGIFNDPFTDGKRMHISARVALSEFMDYPAQFLQTTHGEGRLLPMFDGYDVCHNTDEVLEKEAYKPERDLENTPDSVFCSHGAGYPVKWQEVDAHMHCEIESEYERYI